MVYLTIIYGALLGSIPFAYLVVKLTKKIDIRKEGTGNVGAMNSYDITHEKWVGILVFFLDAFKGLLAIIITIVFFRDNPLAFGLAALFVIIGHNYSVFLKFNGGRGLSAAVGISILLNPIFIVIWGLVWLISYLFISKNVHIENSLAIIVSPIIFWLIPSNIISHLLYYNFMSIEELKFLYAILCLFLMVKHIRPLLSVLRQN